MGFCSEMSHPCSRSNQTTVRACSSERRLAHPKGVQRLEMCRCIIRVVDWHDHALAQDRAPSDRSNPAHVAPHMAPQAHTAGKT